MYNLTSSGTRKETDWAESW